MKKLTLLLLLFVMLTSCKQSEPIIIYKQIRDTIHTIVPKVIIDSGRVQIVTDTIVQYVKVNYNDTIIKVSYYPKYETITIYAKPDTILFRVTDTLYSTQIKEIVKSRDVIDYIIEYTVLLLTVAFVLFVLHLLLKSRETDKKI